MRWVLEQHAAEMRRRSADPKGWAVDIRLMRRRAGLKAARTSVARRTAWWLRKKPKKAA